LAFILYHFYQKNNLKNKKTAIWHSYLVDRKLYQLNAPNVRKKTPF